MRGTDVTDMKRKYRTPNPGDFPDELTITLKKESDLRYGENPNQPAAIYRLEGTSLAELTNVRLAKSGKSGLSATNVMDVTHALEILKYFPQPAVAVMKHLIPSGFATGSGANDFFYQKARDADARSAFGSIVVFNRPIDTATAESLLETFVEGVAAPDYELGAMGILESKKDLRVVLYSNIDKIPKFSGDDIGGLYHLVQTPTGRIIVQRPYLSSIRGKQDLVLDPQVKTLEGLAVTVERDPTPQELEDMLTAWYINLGVRSNGIVIVKDGVTLAVGSGQQERVGAIEQAIVKAYQKAMDREKILYDPIDGARGRGYLSDNPLEGAVVSSDGFLPFRDSVDLLGKHEVSAIIQPGGSIKDYEVIEAVNHHHMAMAFTLERCFGHF